MADRAFVLSVEDELLDEARSADVDRAGMVVAAGCKAADDAKCTDNAIYRFHNFHL
jgi:hypothetical protein